MWSSCKHSMPSDSPVPTRQWFLIGPGFWPPRPSDCADMVAQPDAYRLGPADRLAPLFTLATGAEEPSRSGTGSSILTTLWADELSTRRQRLAALAIELIRANKRILVVCPDHQAADALVGTIARAMKAVGLMYKTWVSRYEMALAQQVEGIGIQELGFEAQMHQFYAKSRADKAALRRKYDRFRELTPVLAYKGQKQKDLDEVRLLEWRLLTQVSDLQAKIKEVNATLAEYENLPLLQATQPAGRREKRRIAASICRAVRESVRRTEGRTRYRQGAHR